MNTLRYLALGDSYTIGEGVPAHERWPEQWASAQRQRGVAIAAPRIIAKTGWSSDELSSAMDEAEPLGQWDRVSLMIGVNDQYRGHAPEHYRTVFSRLLERAIHLAAGEPKHVVVLSIPDWGVTPYATANDFKPANVAADIDIYNQINRDCCSKRNVPWLDITAITRTLGAKPSMLVADGLHPSGAMYALWVEQLLILQPADT